ncbi:MULTISPECIES: hypothetical protein [Chitinophagaceae]
MSNGTNNVLEKALKNISNNYSVCPFFMNGIIRLVSTSDNNYLYNSDAIIDIYHPGYSTNKKSEVKLVRNKLTILKRFKYDSTYLIRWVRNGYRSPLNFDIVHSKDYLRLDEIKRYNFVYKGKEVYNHRTVFLIDFREKSGTDPLKDKMLEGTLFIDSIDYAFVRADLILKNIRTSGFIPIKELVAHIEYSNDNGKYYLKRMSVVTSFLPHNGITVNNTVTYLRTSIDTTQVTPFGYKEKIQVSDASQSTNSLAGGREIAKIDSLFGKAERDKLISPIQYNIVDTMTTSSHNDSVLLQNRFKYQFADYIRNGGLTLGLGISKLPLSVLSNNMDVENSGMYSLLITDRFRLCGRFCLTFESSVNFGVGGISNNKSFNVYITNSFSINKYHRPIYISPYLGYGKIALDRKKSDLSVVYNNLLYGLQAELELTHKSNLYFSSSYYHNLNVKSTYGDPPFRLVHIAYSAGVNFKL